MAKAGGLLLEKEREENGRGARENGLVLNEV